MTDKEKIVFEIIQTKSLWRIPSYTTIMRMSGIKSKDTVHKILKQLVKNGHKITPNV